MYQEHLKPTESVDEFYRIEGENSIGKSDLWLTDEYGLPADRYLYPYTDWTSNTMFYDSFYFNGGTDIWP